MIPRRFSIEDLNTQTINHCLVLAVDAFAISGTVLNIGSRYEEGALAHGERGAIFEGAELIGCDMRSGPGVDRLENAESLSFPDNLVDCVLLLEICEHLPRPERALCEAKRVLKDDGILILSVPFSYRLHGFPTDFWRFTASGIHQLLEPFESKIVVSLGAAVRPATIFAIASNGRNDFAHCARQFREAVIQTKSIINRKLFLQIVQERARDFLGLLLGKANIGALFFDPTDKSRGYKSEIATQPESD